MKFITMTTDEDGNEKYYVEGKQVDTYKEMIDATKENINEV